jgi:sulfatase maturation enzyme AslB (radical SAM superfamily)
MSAGEHTEIKSFKFTQEQADKFYGLFQPEVVSATGGEPLLEYGLVKILAKSTAKYGGALELVTNGLLLAQDKIEELNSLNDKLFYQISLDGTSTYHNDLRQNANAYSAAIKAIELCAKTNRLVKVRMTVTPQNQEQVLGVIKTLEDYKSSNINLVMRPVISSGRAKTNGLSFGEDFNGLPSYTGLTDFIKVETTDNNGKCGCGFNTIAIDPLGEIFPCCYMVFKPEYKMGNFLDNFENLSQNQEFAKFSGTCYARHMMLK